MLRPRSILALTDLSARSEPVLVRAAVLAAAHQAHLRFMYVPPRRADRWTDPTPRLAQRCRVMGRQFEIAVEPVDIGQAHAGQVLREAAQADLVLMHHALGRQRASFWERTLLDRLLRAGHGPVLVVKRPARDGYRHALVAVDLNEHAPHLLTQGQRIGAAVRLTLCHFLDNHVALKAASVSGALDSIDEQRSQERRLALIRLGGIVQSVASAASLEPGVVDIVMGHGRPGTEIPSRQAAASADLVVLGRQRQHWLLDRLARTVGHQVVERVRSDVLLVPLGREAR